jgi:hypothetical protein
MGLVLKHSNYIIMKWVKKIPVAQAKGSHILRPGNTAFKEQFKLVNGFHKIVSKDTCVKEKKVHNLQ